MSTLVIFLIFRIVFSVIFPVSVVEQLPQKEIKETKKIYNILMYRCDICYDYFLTKDDLMKHLEHYHPQKYEDIKSLPNIEKDLFFSRLIKKYESY